MAINQPGNGGLRVERLFLLGLVGALGYACLTIVSPFIPPFIWAMILALSTWPHYLALSRWLGGRRKLAASLMTLAQLLIFVVPAIMALEAMTHHVPNPETLYGQVVGWLGGEPPGWLSQIPLVGERLDADWREGKLFASLEPTKIRSALTMAGQWLLHGSANLAVNGMNIVLAVLMAGLLYSYGENAGAVTEKLALRIGGQTALQATRTAANTVRGVSLGVIGTAVIQALLSGIGFAMAGLDAAPALGLACFLTAVMQIGTSLIWIPVAAWLAHVDQNGWAIFTVVWGVAINIMDNFIKPYFIGLSSPLPFLLIMVGVIGGLLAWGFVGIFLGTTLLAVGYTSFFTWLNQGQVNDYES
jgi:predicted PurR-regulated permease PerM